MIACIVGLEHWIVNLLLNSLWKHAAVTERNVFNILGVGIN